MDSASRSPAKPRRLRGHKTAATTCIASRATPGVIFTAAEDGCVCLFDLRCNDFPQMVMEISSEPISSLCFKQGNEDFLYTSTETEVRCYDVRLGPSSTPLQNFNYNKEEINQIVCNSKASFVAAADDSGDVKIIDIGQKCMFKTLRSGHSSICSTVQFITWKPWEVISGGLDCKLILWDFSKGRAFHVMDFTSANCSQESTAPSYNPPFLHAIAVPEIDVFEKTGKICAVARGDGAVSVIDIESELASKKVKSGSKPRNASKSRDTISAGDNETLNPEKGRTLHLDHSFGGHSAAASCVAFSSFGERGKLIISGGNDKSVKVWNWSGYLDNAENPTDGDSVTPHHIELPRKVNWLCTTPTDSEHLVVCDTSKVVKVFTVT